MLTTKELWGIFTGAKKHGMREGDANDAGLRAVGEAAVKDAMRYKNIFLYLLMVTITVIAGSVISAGGTFGHRCAKLHPKGSSEWQTCITKLVRGEP